MTDRELMQQALEALEQVAGAMPFPVALQVRAALHKRLAQPEQEPVAVHQFRSPHCSDWYDGVPDHHDGHGPYEVRTLYTAPQPRQWQGLVDQDEGEVYERSGGDVWSAALIADEILKRRNT